MELIVLYHERWEEEQVFDEQKTHQDPRRATKPAQLRSETPAGVIQEIYALSLGHFVIRSLMFEAAATVNLDPDRLSFTGCFQILKCRLPECDGKTPATFEAWYQGLLWEMQGERTDPRRNRINPRVIKRKMSKWKKKRPRASASSALDENLSRDSGYNSLNGIGAKAPRHFRLARLLLRGGIRARTTSSEAALRTTQVPLARGRVVSTALRRSQARLNRSPFAKGVLGSDLPDVLPGRLRFPEPHTSDKPIVPGTVRLARTVHKNHVTSENRSRTQGKSAIP